MVGDSLFVDGIIHGLANGALLPRHVGIHGCRHEPAETNDGRPVCIDEDCPDTVGRKRIDRVVVDGCNIHLAGLQHRGAGELFGRGEKLNRCELRIDPPVALPVFDRRDLDQGVFLVIAERIWPRAYRMIVGGLVTDLLHISLGHDRDYHAVREIAADKRDVGLIQRDVELITIDDVDALDQVTECRCHSGNRRRSHRPLDRVLDVLGGQLTPALVKLHAALEPDRDSFARGTDFPALGETRLGLERFRVEIDEIFVNCVDIELAARAAVPG